GGNATIDPGGGEGVVHAVLRVFGGLAAALEDGPSLGRGQQARAGTALELRQPADVVEMLVAVEEELHVGQREAQRFDIGGDRRGTFGGATVDQHVALIAGDEQRRDPARADVPGVAVDAERRTGLVPIVPVGADFDPTRVVCSRTLRCHLWYGSAAGDEQSGRREKSSEHSLPHWHR